MIGLDTNVLVRIFVSEGGDDEARARAFLAERSAPGAFFVPTIVLVELVWTLRSRYRFSRSAVSEVLSSLLDSDDFVVEHRSFVEEALRREVSNAADFADMMIAECCLAAGCERTFTLDEAAAKTIPSMDLVP
jgi:predicted nucleic-acid-binding protein